MPFERTSSESKPDSLTMELETDEPVPTHRRLPAFPDEPISIRLAAFVKEQPSSLTQLFEARAPNQDVSQPLERGAVRHLDMVSARSPVSDDKGAARARPDRHNGIASAHDEGIVEARIERAARNAIVTPERAALQNLKDV